MPGGPTETPGGTDSDAPKQPDGTRSPDPDPRLPEAKRARVDRMQQDLATVMTHLRAVVGFKAPLSSLRISCADERRIELQWHYKSDKGHAICLTIIAHATVESEITCDIEAVHTLPRGGFPESRSTVIDTKPLSQVTEAFLGKMFKEAVENRVTAGDSAVSSITQPALAQFKSEHPDELSCDEAIPNLLASLQANDDMPLPHRILGKKIRSTGTNLASFELNWLSSVPNPDDNSAFVIRVNADPPFMVQEMSNSSHQRGSNEYSEGTYHGFDGRVIADIKLTDIVREMHDGLDDDLIKKFGVAFQRRRLAAGGSLDRPDAAGGGDTEKIQLLTGQLTAAKEELAQLLADRGADFAVKATLWADLQSALDETAIVREQLQAALGANTELTEEHDRLIAEIAQLHSQLQELQSKAKAKSQSAESGSAEDLKIVLDLESISEELRLAQERIAGLERSVMETDVTLAAAIAAKRQAEGEAARLNHVVRESDGLISTLKTEAARRTELYDNAVGQNRTLRAELDRVNAEINSLRKEIERFTQRIQQQDRGIQFAEGELKRLHEVILKKDEELLAKSQPTVPAAPNDSVVQAAAEPRLERAATQIVDALKRNIELAQGTLSQPLQDLFERVKVLMKERADESKAIINKFRIRTATALFATAVTVFVSTGLIEPMQRRVNEHKQRVIEYKQLTDFLISGARDPGSPFISMTMVPDGTGGFYLEGVEAETKRICALAILQKPDGTIVFVPYTKQQSRQVTEEGKNVPVEGLPVPRE